MHGNEHSLRDVGAAVGRSLRILAVAETWQGATDYGFVRAFRNAGHSVMVCPSDRFFPSGWSSKALRIARRLLFAQLVREYNDDLLAKARALRPHLFFAYAGAYVLPATLQTIREGGTVAVNLYPDTTFRRDGGSLAGALARYDWIFQTKSFGVDDVRTVNENVSFMEHGFDAETHRRVTLDDRDRNVYACDASFIGTWSAKKGRMLADLHRVLPELRLNIWGNQWERATEGLGPGLMRSPVLGLEFSKAIAASDINLAILIEAQPGAPQGDLTTTRTFEIPAVGGFMLHERNDEVRGFFEEGRDCAMFDGLDELVAKVRHYLANPEERARIAAAGRHRALTSGYSTDAHAAKVVEKCLEIRRQRGDTT